MKKERLKSEKDEKTIANKTRLLSNEEIKVNKRQRIDIDTQGNKEKIRVNLLHDKEILNEAKKSRLQDLNKKKKKNKQMKLQINSTLKNWRTQLAKHNKNEVKIIEREKMKIDEVCQLFQEEKQKKNKLLHDNIQYCQSIADERRKKQEIDRKIKSKQELESRIRNEIAVKSELDNKINGHQEKSMLIVKRISSFTDLSLSPSISKKDIKGLSHHASISQICKNK